MQWKSGLVTGPKREGFYPCGPMCCRCGARDGRIVEEVTAPCGCKPCFCEECRQEEGNPHGPFSRWIAGYSSVCKIRPPHEHVNYSECWGAGIEPTDAREERDGSFDLCVCGHQQKWHNWKHEGDPRMRCSRCWKDCEGFSLNHERSVLGS